MTKPSLGDVFRKQKQDAAEAAARAALQKEAEALQAKEQGNIQRIGEYLDKAHKHLKQGLTEAEQAVANGDLSAAFKNPEPLEFYERSFVGQRWDFEKNIARAVENHPAYKKMHTLCRRANIALTIAVGYEPAYTRETNDPDMRGYGDTHANVYVVCRTDFDKPYQAPAKPAKTNAPRR